jgi:hypothetical protein
MVLYIGLFVGPGGGGKHSRIYSKEGTNPPKKGEKTHFLRIFDGKSLPICRSQDFDALLSFALDGNVEWLIVRLSGSQGSKRSSTQPAI